MTACKADFLVAAMCQVSVLCFAAPPVNTCEQHRHSASNRDNVVTGQPVQTTPTHIRCERPFQQAAFVKQAGMAQDCIALCDEVGGKFAISKCTVDPIVAATASIVRVGNGRNRHVSLSG